MAAPDQADLLVLFATNTSEVGLIAHFVRQV
jgi:hypothetical protein